jgi:hypothetical protein
VPYGTEDIPKNHLIMDPWIQHCYLPDKQGYRKESKYPTSHAYYKEFLSVVADNKLSNIVNGFEQQAKNDKNERKRGYIGPLENYQEFLVNHPDGLYIVIDQNSRHKVFRQVFTFSKSEGVSKDYFKKAPEIQDVTYHHKGGELFYDRLYFAVTELINQRK